MQRLAALALACLAAGCSTTHQRERESPRSLLDAADCVARNVENYGSLLTTKFTPRWKISKNPDSIQISADAAWMPWTSIRAWATIGPHGTGTLITVDGFGDLRARMAEGC